MNRPGQFIPSLLLLLTLPLLASCTGLLDADRAPEQTWWLEPVPAPAAQAGEKSSPLTLNVTAVPGLDTDLVLTINDEARLNHFAGARWPDHTPELIASLLVRSLQNSGQFEAVSKRHARPSSGCHMDLEVRRYFARVNSAETAQAVEIEIAGQLNCDNSSRAITAKSTQSVSGTTIPSVIAAFQSGLNDVTKDLLEQL